MSVLRKRLIIFAVIFLLTNGMYHAASADDHGHKERKRHGKSSDEHNDNKRSDAVNNPRYKESCGACHFAYQPGLLPSGSWEKILTGIDNHFGEKIVIEPESGKIIANYLKSNAAEYSSGKLSAKIMKSLGNQTPMRITDIPYIGKKHKKISSAILSPKSVGSLSNCHACHKTADQGIYKDKHIVIPR